MFNDFDNESQEKETRLLVHTSISLSKTSHSPLSTLKKHPLAKIMFLPINACCSLMMRSLVWLCVPKLSTSRVSCPKNINSSLFYNVNSTTDMFVQNLTLLSLSFLNSKTFSSREKILAWACEFALPDSRRPPVRTVRNLHRRNPAIPGRRRSRFGQPEIRCLQSTLRKRRKVNVNGGSENGEGISVRFLAKKLLCC